jgi:hypothetical protein
MQVDFRQPLAFKQVYRVPGQPEQFMRANGALYATFPLSAYRSTADGVQVLIPAGTVFHIGAPWLLFGPPPPDSTEKSETAIELLPMQTRLDLLMPPAQQTAQPTGAFRENEQDVLDWSTTPPMRHPWSLHLAAMNLKARETTNIDVHAGSIVRAPVPTVANNAAYRSKRLAALLEEAAHAEKQRDGGETDEIEATQATQDDQ